MAARGSRSRGGRAASGTNRKALAQTLERWQQDAALAPLRDGAGLLLLPDAERGECEALWRAVQELLDRARRPAASAA